MTSSLVGSEMCIRDSDTPTLIFSPPTLAPPIRAYCWCPSPLLCRSETVSYTHLTLPTICSV
eukprot:7145819-Prorocentrum_lima.AAC.1